MSQNLPLGCFSISLTVKDLEASRAFYEALGFSDMGGNPEHGYLIMKNGDSLVGLFKGMFERNMLTFNPGWNTSAQPLDEFVDVREIRRQVEAAGYQTEQVVEPDGTGPASFIVVDPDGNPVLVDQHR